LMPLPHSSQGTPATGQATRLRPGRSHRNRLLPRLLPSSQPSPVSRTPLPHLVHGWPAVGQRNPVSIKAQSWRQPSPSLRLPSSQTSLPSTRHCRTRCRRRSRRVRAARRARIELTGRTAAVARGQVAVIARLAGLDFAVAAPGARLAGNRTDPADSTWQPALQPSPSLRLWSSQASELSLIPLPQPSQGYPPTGQANPGSTAWSNRHCNRPADRVFRLARLQVLLDPVANRSSTYRRSRGKRSRSRSRSRNGSRRHFTLLPSSQASGALHGAIATLQAGLARHRAPVVWIDSGAVGVAAIIRRGVGVIARLAELDLAIAALGAMLPGTGQSSRFRAEHCASQPSPRVCCRRRTLRCSP